MPTNPNHTNLSRRISNQTVVDRSVDCAVHSSEVGKNDRGVLDERNERTSEADEAGSIDRRAGAHVVDPGGVNARGPEVKIIMIKRVQQQ